MTFSPLFSRVFPATFDRRAAAAAAGWSTWFDHVWIAKGAASKATSLTDLVGAATLTESGTVGWSAAGWTFSSSYLLTGVTLNTASTLMVQFSGGNSLGTNPAGVFTFGSRKGFRPANFGNAAYYFAFTNSTVSPDLLAGNIAIAGDQPYRNGAPDGGAISGTIGTPLECYIGSMNGGTSNIFSETVIAVGINSITQLTGAQVAAAALAMAAL